MGDSYTTLWSSDRTRDLRRHGQEGALLTVLFGGPHQSLPRFRRYGVRAGDWIYPIRVHEGVLYLLGRMKVRRLISLEAYIEENPDLFAGCARGYPMLTLNDYLARHPEQRYLAPTCVDEVALGEQGTLLRLDIAVPPGVVERLRFRSQKGERAIKHLENGRITNTLSLQGGTYRLAPEPAQELAAWLTDALARRAGGDQGDRVRGMKGTFVL